MATDFKLINQDQRGHAWTLPITLNQQCRCFTLSLMEMQLHIFQASWAIKNPKYRFFSSYYSAHWLSNVRRKTHRKGLVAEIVWIQANISSEGFEELQLFRNFKIRQRQRLSKGNCFLRYTDNETEKSFQNWKLNMTL